MANQTITQLPDAGPITGTELVPIVQNGGTFKTTASALAGSPVQTQTFLTLAQEPTLNNSRFLSSSTGVGLVDGGAQSFYRITLNGASGSLETASNGIVAKDSASTVVARTLTTTGNGISVTDGDGVSGNPTFQLTGIAEAIANMGGTSMLAIVGGATIAGRQILGTTDQINVTNGDGSGNPTISIADDAVLPGAGAVTVPVGTIGERPVGSLGQIRYSTSAASFEGYTAAGWNTIAAGAGITLIDTGTGLTGGPITSTGTISLASTAVTAGTYGSSTQVGQFAVNAQGQLTSASNVTISPSGIGAVASVAGTANEITATGTTNVVVSLPSALTFTGKTVTNGTFNMAAATVGSDTVTTNTATQTLTNKTLASPLVTGTLKLTASGAGAYTPFAQTFASFVSNFNGYQLNYIQNTNNGSDASVDYVAYNDGSDVDSYFIDTGISSSNFTDPVFTVFPANGGYVYTGGGTSGQASALLLGTSNVASDIVFFTGGTLLANTRATIKGTGNFLIGTSTDTGYKLNVDGTTFFGGASTFGSTVLLNANPTLALEAATKQYVDSAVLTGFVIHDPVVYATIAALPANTYNNGASGVGATLTAVVNGALSVDGTAVATSQRILVRSEVVQANNGVYTVTQAGSAILPYILTRATDFDTAAAGEIANNAYFFVTSGPTQAGDSYVLSQTAAITVGTTALPFTLFADQAVYSGGTNITVAGQIISVSGTIAATLGGTGTSTVTTGDLLYGSAANTWSKLPLGIAYKSLIVNASGTQVEWNAVPLNETTAVSGQLGVSNGGTGASTLTGYVKASGTSAFTASATIPNTDISGLGTMSTQDANAVAITGGSINGTTVGATTASTGAFTTLTASSTATLNTFASSGATITGGTINGTTIGATTATTGNFTTVTATTGIFGGTF